MPPSPTLTHAARLGRGVTALALGLSIAFPGGAAAQPSRVDEICLPRLLRADGFVPPERFKALVGVVRPSDGEPPAIDWFDWEGTSDDRDDWWPASSIKIYAAIAALERTRALGFAPSARLTYHYEGDERPYQARASDIVRQALVASNNQAFNRLVELVGFDPLNRRFFSSRNGLARTVFLRSYSGRIRDPETGHGINRHSPRITIEDRRHRRELPARDGTGRFECPDQGNCTTLRELAESMRRVMLHERLPEDERFQLEERELALLREALEAPRREHGMLLVEAIQRGFGEGVPLRVYHKPGYAYRWTSDVMFIHRTDTDQRWIVAAAAYANRRVLDDALDRIGGVLASDRLPRLTTPPPAAEASP